MPRSRDGIIITAHLNSDSILPILGTVVVLGLDILQVFFWWRYLLRWVIGHPISGLV